MLEKESESIGYYYYCDGCEKLIHEDQVQADPNWKGSTGNIYHKCGMGENIAELVEISIENKIW